MYGDNYHEQNDRYWEEQNRRQREETERQQRQWEQQRVEQEQLRNQQEYERQQREIDERITADLRNQQLTERQRRENEARYRASLTRPEIGRRTIKSNGNIWFTLGGIYVISQCIVVVDALCNNWQSLSAPYKYVAGFYHFLVMKPIGDTFYTIPKLFFKNTITQWANLNYLIGGILLCMYLFFLYIIVKKGLYDPYAKLFGRIPILVSALFLFISIPLGIYHVPYTSSSSLNIILGLVIVTLYCTSMVYLLRSSYMNDMISKTWLILNRFPSNSLSFLFLLPLGFIFLWWIYQWIFG